MPRKKKPAEEAANAETTQSETSAAATGVAEPSKTEGPAPEAGDTYGPTNPAAKNWGPPYKPILTSTENGFEMGEDRRYKQRVFKFADKPTAEVLAKLKDAGFIYRANEKAWTIPANPDTRKLSEDLAHQFAGQDEARGR